MQPLRNLASHPTVQDLLKRAVNLRSDLMDQLDDRIGGVAKHLNLVTRREMKVVKRQVRELENQVATLEHQLTQEKLRADRAEKDLGDALKASRKAAQELKDLRDAALARSAAEAAAAKPAEPEPAPKKARTRKKADTGAEQPTLAEVAGAGENGPGEAAIAPEGDEA